MIAPKITDKDFDDGIPFILARVNEAQKDKNDDFFLMIVGLTGTGKSVLMQHIMTLYLKDTIGMEDIDYIAFDRKGFANGLKKAKEKDFPKICVYDEANVSKRDSLSKFNKQLIDLYMAIRGLRIFHIWCNPSLDMIDRWFIEERIKGMIVVTTKDIDRPRTYYYFTQKKLLEVWDKYVGKKGKKLSIPLLKRIAKKYAYYKGWFRNYNGILKQPYDEKKLERMKEKVEDFFNSWGESEQMIDRKKIMSEVGVTNTQTINMYEKELIERAIIEEDRITCATNGKKLYPAEYLEHFKALRDEKIKNSMQSWGKKPTVPLLEGFGGPDI